METKRGYFTVGRIAHLAVLTAILIILEVTNIGMIRIGPLEMTIMHIPVIVGAIILGPTSGAVMGGIFGLISFFECVIGKSWFGASLFGINPFFAFLVCVPTRMLMGRLCGLIFVALQKLEKTRKIASFAVAGLSGALLNTVFFMTALMVLFGRTEFIMGFRGDLNIIPFIVAFVGLQGLVEAILAFFTGTVISRALFNFTQRQLVKVR
ncbi:MAG: ECF transporter S component [Clostridiales bacterium]|nr:ECF transporter S component [Clostridiales bacterium]